MHVRALVPVPPGPSRPGVGERASGHGVAGVIAAVPDLQPLAQDGIWRVSLAGESFGRLVRLDARSGGAGARERPGEWQLLQLDDVTDEQLETYEAAMRDAPRAAGAAPAPGA